MTQDSHWLDYYSSTFQLPVLNPNQFYSGYTNEIQDKHVETCCQLRIRLDMGDMATKKKNIYIFSLFGFWNKYFYFNNLEEFYKLL